jgi:hypothetical protein
VEKTIYIRLEAKSPSQKFAELCFAPEVVAQIPGVFLLMELRQAAPGQRPLGFGCYFLFLS